MPDQIDPNVTEIVECDNKILFGPLSEAIEYLQDVCKQYPEARLELSWEDYEVVELQFSWTRPATDEELAARIEFACQRAEQERREVEALRKRLELEKEQRRATFERLNARLGRRDG